MSDDSLNIWDWALKIAAALATTVAALTIPPPSSSLAGSLLDWPRIAVFVLAFLILGGSQFVAKRVRLGFALVILGIACLLGYFFALQAWSCQLEQGRVVTGNGLRPAAAQYLSENPNSSCVDLLVSFASDPLRVYEGVAVHEAMIGSLYVAVIALLSMGVLSVLSGKRAG